MVTSRKDKHGPENFANFTANGSCKERRRRREIGSKGKGVRMCTTLLEAIRDTPSSLLELGHDHHSTCSVGTPPDGVG